MLSSQVRSSLTSQGYLTISPWIDQLWTYSLAQINLGSNPIGSLEIVSALNSFNLGRSMLHYHSPSRTAQYNPKVYLGAVQSVSPEWNYDYDENRKGELRDPQKSGSWPLFL